MTYELTLAHGREKADFITSKAQDTLDALFVEYSTILGGNISKPTPNAQPPLGVGVGTKCRKGEVERMEEDPSA